MARHQTDILKQPIPTLLITFAALLAAIVVRSLCHPVGGEAIELPLSPAGEWLNGWLRGGWGATVGIGSVVVTSIIVTRITSRYSLSVIRSFVPIVLYVICICGTTYPMGNPSLGLALLMIVHATELMILSFRRSEQFGYVMRGAFWCGMAALIVPDLVYVVALLPLHGVVWQRSVREMVAGTIMLLLPMLHASIFYWMDGQALLWFGEQWCGSIREWQMVEMGRLYHSIGGLTGSILLGSITLLSLTSIALFATNYGTMRIRARKGHIIFSALYIVGAVMLLVAGSPTAIALPIMGIGAAPLIYTFFVKRKGWVSTLIYISIMLMTLLHSLVGHIVA